MLKSVEKLSGTTFIRQELQTEEALTVNASADKASVVLGTKSNCLSDNRNVRLAGNRG